METNNKLREVLAGLLDVMHDMGIDEDTIAIAVESKHCLMYSQEHLDTIKKANAALAAPPRNCDVGTVEEQYSRMYRTCYNWMCRDCKTIDKDFRKCALSWAQMPYKEGGGK